MSCRYPILAGAGSSYGTASGNTGLANGGATNPSEAVLFHRETDAIEARNRLGLGGDAADTFITTIVLSTHQGEWTAEELTAYLQRHRKIISTRTSREEVASSWKLSPME